MRFVQAAFPGSDETGYSQALVGLDDEWRGAEIRALLHETAVIENQTEAVSNDPNPEELPTSMGGD